MAAKENGETLYNLLKWLRFPVDESDDSKFISHDSMKYLCDAFLEMLFGFKHRGAIDKAADTFSLLCSKLLNSSN